MSLRALGTWIVVLAGLTLSACADGGSVSGSAPAPATPGTRTLSVAGRTVTVEMALETPTRAQGLMYRTALPADAGMLFLFPRSEPRTFWMRNTRIPLDIAFLEDDGTIINVRSAPPMVERPGFTSLRPCRVVLEMNQGWFEAAGLRPGDRVPFPPAWLDEARP